MDDDTYISPYKLPTTHQIPPQHRLFYHYNQGHYYCYGCNTAYCTDESFKTLSKKTIFFPFYTTTSDWFFHSQIHFRGLNLAVINQSLYILNKLNLAKLCDTPEHQGNPLFIHNDALCFISRSKTYEFSFQKFEFSEINFPQIQSFHALGTPNSPAFYDSAKREIVTLEKNFPCQKLIFCCNNLVLASKKVQKRVFYSLIDLQNDKIYEIEDAEFLEIDLSNYSLKGVKTGLRLEESSVFSGFDDQIWYDLEEAYLAQECTFVHEQLIDVLVDNIVNIEKICDLMNKQQLWAQRYKVQVSQQERLDSRAWAQEMKNDVIAVGKVITCKIIQGE